MRIFLFVFLVSLSLADWDIADELTIPPSTYEGSSQCTSVFAIVTAIEIKMSRGTGEYVELSKQEVMDCMLEPCSIRWPVMLANWLKIQGRLAPKAGYPDYTGEVSDCRAGVAPNALYKTQVNGLKKVSVEGFEEAIKKYGSVIACLSRECTPEGEGDENEGCSSQVLIVGYGEEEDVPFYRVLDGNNIVGPAGFSSRVRRGTNECGIESHMYVVETAPRETPQEVAPGTLCPLSLPLWCEDTRTCRSHDQHCIRVGLSMQSSDEAGDGAIPAEEAYDSPEIPDHCRDKDEWYCRSVADDKTCTSPWMQGRCPGSCRVCDNKGNPRCRDVDSVAISNCSTTCPEVREYCGSWTISRQCEVTCGVNWRYCGAYCQACDDKDKPLQCRDVDSVAIGNCSTTCSFMKDHCDSPSIRRQCEVTCGVNPLRCGEGAGDDGGGPRGGCYVPEVEHGVVVGAGEDGQIGAGETLSVRCDEGYVLTGEPRTCVIQNVYGPDSRRMQWCRPETGEEWTGTGEDYEGTVSTTVRGVECANWAEVADVGMGKYQYLKELGLIGQELGNHNFCRNPNGYPAPWCVVNRQYGHQKQYCFKYAKCEAICTGEAINMDISDDCDPAESWKCELKGQGSLSTWNWYWTYCHEMCCNAAGCQTAQMEK